MFNCSSQDGQGITISLSIVVRVNWSFFVANMQISQDSSLVQIPEEDHVVDPIDRRRMHLADSDQNGYIRFLRELNLSQMKYSEVL